MSQNKCATYEAIPSLRISWETYRRLIAIRESLYKEGNKVTDMDSVVSRLIEAWDEHLKASIKR
ncbi:MAG: hypothetical protein ACP5IM_05855 [Candidatus Bathyarchaeia archaeon]